MDQQKLYSACKSGDLKEIQQLHASGADMDVTRPDNHGWTPMCIACHEGHFEIVQWLHTHGAATDVMRPTWQGKKEKENMERLCFLVNQGMTPMDIACQKGHLNIVKHLIHHHNISKKILRLYEWYPRLSIHNKDQLHQAALENVVHCQSFFALATIVSCINIEPYKVMNEETGRLVVPKSSILRFRRQHGGMLLRMIASYLCGGKRARHLWGLILSPYGNEFTGHTPVNSGYMNLNRHL